MLSFLIIIIGIRSFLLHISTIITLLLQLKYQPFNDPRDNYLETLSLGLLFVYHFYTFFNLFISNHFFTILLYWWLLLIVKIYAGFLDNGEPTFLPFVVVIIACIFLINIIVIIIQKVREIDFKELWKDTKQSLKKVWENITNLLCCRKAPVYDNIVIG